MGLLTSDDAAATSNPVSLQGEIDFHALAVSGADVIGDGGGQALMVSDDDEKSCNGAKVQAVTLADSGERILATTQSGLQVSTDGGKAFTTVSDAPVLALLSAGTHATMLGLGPQGVMCSSTDCGESWTRVGEAPDAQAAAAARDGGGFALSQSMLFSIG